MITLKLATPSIKVISVYRADMPGRITINTCTRTRYTEYPYTFLLFMEGLANQTMHYQSGSRPHSRFQQPIKQGVDITIPITLKPMNGNILIPTYQYTIESGRSPSFLQRSTATSASSQVIKLEFWSNQGYHS